ncbi:MAG: hypothetical protein K8S98_05545 [Planctomycetes bacterium]|nr:hypothetical protein [Planctomycetota bacterium]
MAAAPATFFIRPAPPYYGVLSCRPSGGIDPDPPVPVCEPPPIFGELNDANDHAKLVAASSAASASKHRNQRLCKRIDDPP